MLAPSISSKISGRDRRVLAAGVASGASQVINICVQLVSVPMLVSRLGSGRYGILLVILTLPTLLSAADLGIGSALVPLLAAERADDYERRRAVVANGLAALTVVCLCLMSLLILPTLVWPDVVGHVLGAPSGLQPEAIKAAQWAGALLSITVPAAIGARLLMAVEQSWLCGLAATGQSLLTLGGISFLAATPAPSLSDYVVVVLGGIGLAQAMQTAYVFARWKGRLTPLFREASYSGVKRLLKTGLSFASLGASAAISFQLDTWVLASILSSEAVATYGTALRLFSLGPIASAFFLTPLWGAYSNAFAEGDLSWIRRTFMRSVIVSGVVNLAWGGICLLAGADIIRLWAHGSLRTPPGGLLWVLFIWTLMNSLIGPLSVLLNSARVMRPQVIAAMVMSVVNVTASILTTYRYGVVGPIVGSILGQLAVMLPVSVGLAWRVLRGR